jgi:tripartite-type tricarboxylate transporter receptor subunit TctC
MVVVHPSLAVKSISELIAVAKARPGQFSYASGITGASSHLAAELFNAMAKVDIVRIPYKGNGPALTAISAGEVQVSFANAAAALPHVRAARLRALAVTSAQPSALVPELPTVAASGLPDYVSVSIIGVFAPAKTPSALVALLNREIVRGLRKAETKDRLFAAGAEVVASSPDEFAFAIKSEMIKLGAIAKKIRIVAD